MVWNPGVLRGGTPGSLLLLMPSPSDSLWAMHDLEDLLARAAGVAREFGATRWLLLGRAVLLCALVWLPDGEPAAWGQAIYATPYVFSTIAGNAGYGIADGTGSAARFNSPMGIAVGGAGELYVTDAANSTVRVITPGVSGGKTNWTVATIAGLAGSRGSADGAGSAARFSLPHGIAVDTAGNLYVADTVNNTIRMLTRSLSGGQTVWTVSTIAGSAAAPGTNDGVGGAAQFNGPTDVAVARDGSLYVTDTANRVIRMITPSVSAGQTNWVVSTIACEAGSAGGGTDGTGSAARFQKPFGITLDGAGNLYATDYSGSTIRMLTRSLSGGQTAWTVSTIAGSYGQPGANDGVGQAALFAIPYGITVNGPATSMWPMGRTRFAKSPRPSPVGRPTGS